MKTLLFLKANPIDSKDLRLENEEKAVQEALETGKERELFRIEPRGAITKSDLTKFLNNLNPNYLHLSGHGDTDNNILIEDNEGYKEEIPTSSLIKLIENYNDVELVFLNTCHSLTGIADIQSSIDYIIGMKDKVPNKYALEFSKEFYKALFSGKSIRSSFNIASEFLDLRTYPKDLIPEIIGRKLKKETELDELKKGNGYPLVTQNEINKAKQDQKTAKRLPYSILALLTLMSLCLFYSILRSEQYELSLKLIPSVIPILLGNFPLSEITKRNTIVNLLELFELQIERFKNTYKYLAKEDVERLNERFLTIINI